MESAFAEGRGIKAFLVEAAMDTSIFIFLGLRTLTDDGQAVSVPGDTRQESCVAVRADGLFGSYRELRNSNYGAFICPRKERNRVIPVKKTHRTEDN